MAARPEFELHELTADEMFFLVTMRGLKPDSSLPQVMEMRQMMLGMTEAQKRAKLRAAVDSLLARGYLRYARDAHGEIARDPQTQEPVYETYGVIVARLSQAKSKGFSH